MSLDAWASSRADRCPGCGHHVATQGCHCAGSEWAIFAAAVRKAARRDGTVHPGDVRPLIRGRVAPKHIGTLYRRAKAEGLLTDTGEREPSNDFAGRNGDKLDRIYALRGAA